MTAGAGLAKIVKMSFMGLVLLLNLQIPSAPSPQVGDGFFHMNRLFLRLLACLVILLPLRT